MIRITRDEFINQIADWRPEYNMKNQMLLGAEREGKIGFFIENHSETVYFVLKDLRTNEVLFRKLHPALVALKQ